MEPVIKTASEIFGIFLANNVHQGYRYGVGDILAIDKEREFRWTFAGNHYRAIVSRTELWKGPCVSIAIRCPFPDFGCRDRMWEPVPFMDDIGRYFYAGGFWCSECPNGMEITLPPKDMRNLQCKISFIRSGPSMDDSPPA